MRANIQQMQHDGISLYLSVHAWANNKDFTNII